MLIFLPSRVVGLRPSRERSAMTHAKIASQKHLQTRKFCFLLKQILLSNLIRILQHFTCKNSYMHVYFMKMSDSGEGPGHRNGDGTWSHPKAASFNCTFDLCGRARARRARFLHVAYVPVDFLLLLLLATSRRCSFAPTKNKHNMLISDLRFQIKLAY